MAAQALWQEMKLHLYSTGPLPGRAGKRGGLHPSLPRRSALLLSQV